MVFAPQFTILLASTNFQGVPRHTLHTPMITMDQNVNIIRINLIRIIFLDFRDGLNTNRIILIYWEFKV